MTNALVEPGSKAPGDFLTAMAVLTPTGDAVAAISAYFGFGTRTKRIAPVALTQRHTKAQAEPTAPAPIRRPPLRSRLVALQPAASTATVSPPSWLTAATLPSGPITHAYELPITPLFRPNLARAILIGAAAQERPTGEIDIAALIQAISRGTLPLRVPRRPVSGLGGRVQLLVDAGKALQAFAADIEALVEDTIRFVGYHQIQVAWFRDSPSHVSLTMVFDGIASFSDHDSR
jgi:hypothetical protein